ncbi:plant intracellular Ras-group-related LRR protein [Trifolium repens]|nr:plant intracellular Ras-group-related LRR protein [Trifolium repens]
MRQIKQNQTLHLTKHLRKNPQLNIRKINLLKNLTFFNFPQNPNNSFIHILTTNPFHQFLHKQPITLHQPLLSNPQLLHTLHMHIFHLQQSLIHRHIGVRFGYFSARSGDRRRIRTRTEGVEKR